jgi:hypothetical protein
MNFKLVSSKAISEAQLIEYLQIPNVVVIILAFYSPSLSIFRVLLKEETMIGVHWFVCQALQDKPTGDLSHSLVTILIVLLRALEKIRSF